MQRFGDLLSATLASQQLTQREFARRAHMPYPNLSEIIAGRRKPPMRRLNRWLEVLAIPADQREAWRRTAALAHAKAEVHELVKDLESQIDGLRQQLGATSKPT